MGKDGTASLLEGFSPGYFALVMATGIVSLAVHFEGWDWFAVALLCLNAVAFIVLWVLTVARFIAYRRQFIADLTHHSRGALFLTAAAGTCILGTQFAVLTRWTLVAACLWVGGSGLGLILSYTFFVAITICDPKPTLAAGINGAWLLSIVAIESITVLGVLICDSSPSPRLVLFASLSTFLVGAMLYMFFATLIMYRWMFFSMKPEGMTPDYWIDMGALAITTLAGALLLQKSSQWSMIKELAPFLTGATLFFWATATWWIPLLLLVDLWRHAGGRVPFKYGPVYWTMVFPLGMYAVATFTLSDVTGLHFLSGIARVFTYIALLAWIIVFTGLLHKAVRQPK